jgi:hypothetical protein
MTTTTANTLPITAESKLTKSQTRIVYSPVYESDGRNYQAKVELRFDDECGNGHNSFAITADVYLCDIKGNRVRWESGGCCHDEIVKAMPQYEKFIKWHLTSTDGPMHYGANTVYLAGDRDCNGFLKGEPSAFETVISFGENPIKHKFGKRFTKFLQEAKSHPGSEQFDFEVIAVAHEDRAGENYNFEPKYTFGGFDARWYECPFDTESGALNFLYALQHCEPKFTTVAVAWGKGKARELDAARRSAVWPDATDEELTAPGLRERLDARLPGLLTEFRAAMEKLGFVW